VIGLGIYSSKNILQCKPFKGITERSYWCRTGGARKKKIVHIALYKLPSNVLHDLFCTFNGYFLTVSTGRLLYHTCWRFFI
jgi:hypothetical protein